MSESKTETSAKQVREVCDAFDAEMTRIDTLSKEEQRPLQKTALKTLQQKMAALFVQHGGKIMQEMWGFNGDSTYDIVGDLSSAGGYVTSVKHIMTGVIDEIIALKTPIPISSDIYHY
jgi:hypothetical protein